MIQDDCIVICYPAGSGGTFLETSLRSTVKNTVFSVDTELGHCHALRLMTTNFISGDSIISFNNELSTITSWDFVTGEIYANHYRNLIALQQHGIAKNIPMWFIKIQVDCDNLNEIEFVSQMVFRKNAGLFDINLYDQIRDSTWPKTVEQYLTWDPTGDKFLDTIRHSIQSWYWVENYFTRDRTVCLTLRDIFLGDSIVEKLSAWFDPDQMNRFSKLHQHYVTTNRAIHGDLYKLLEK